MNCFILTQSYILIEFLNKRLNGIKVLKKSVAVNDTDKLDLIGDVDEKSGKTSYIVKCLRNFNK